MTGAFSVSSGRLPPSIGFRQEADSDRAFLLGLYASTRQEEMAQVDWSDAQKASFLQMQFEAQHQYYRQHFPAANYLVVERDKTAIGRIYLDRRPSELRLIDIALVPQERNQGLGKALLMELLDQAGSSGLPERIHVEKYNPAMRLYLRLGFRPIEDQGVYELMEWQPESPGEDVASG